MKRLRKVLAVVIASALAFSVAACRKQEKSADEIVKDAVGTLLNAEQADVFEEMGIRSVFDNMSKNAFKTEIGLTLEDSAIAELSSFKNASVDMTFAADSKNSKLALDMDASLGIMKLTVLEAYADSTQIAVKSPDLFDKVFYADYSGDLKSKLANAAVLELAGVSADDLEAMLSGAAGSVTPSTSVDSKVVTEFAEGFNASTKAVDTLKEAVEVKAGEKKSFEISGKNKECQGYVITVPKKAQVDFVVSLVEYVLTSDKAATFWEEMNGALVSAGAGSAEEIASTLETITAQFKENKDETRKELENALSDAVVEMYLSDGKIASLTFEMTVATDADTNGKIKAELICKGGTKSIYENFELSIDASDFGVPAISVERTADYDNKAYKSQFAFDIAGVCGLTSEFNYDKKAQELDASAELNYGVDSIALAVEGSLENITKKSFTFKMDKLSVVMNGAELVELSGKFAVSDDVKIEMPEGTRFDIFTTNMSDWQSLIAEIGSIFGGFDSEH